MIDVVSEIKSRLNIEDIVSQYVQLKRAGRNLKGLCPFHHEKTPSFMVSPDKQIAYCFGCHKGGDIFKFVQEVEGVEFKDAIKILAERAGIDPKEYEYSQESAHSKSEKDELYEMHRKTAKFYSDYLWNSDEGKPVLEYLHKRGLTDISIKDFEIGFSPDSFDKTHLFLVKDGYSRKAIVTAGIGIAKETHADNIYDRFRGRLMFPIYDSAGRVLGFGGRALKPGDEPKYLNSPDSPIYKKSEVLYGYNFAKDSVKQTGEMILVEGYFDVIMSHQAGVKNTAATSGTALTIQQIKLIKRTTQKLFFCFDTDNAGIEAAKRGFELAEKEGMNVSVITVPGFKDPADYVLEYGNKWTEVIKTSVPFMEFCIDGVVKKHDMKTIDGKKNALKEIIQYLKLIESPFEKDQYVRDIAHKLDSKETQIYDELKKNSGKEKFHITEEKAGKSPTAYKFTVADVAFGLIYEHPVVLHNLFADFPEEALSESEKNIYNIYKDNYNLLAEDLRKDFLLCLSEELCQKTELISLYIEDIYGTFNDEMIEKEFRMLINKIKTQNGERERRNISYQIKEAEKRGDKEEAMELLQKLNQIVTS